MWIETDTAGALKAMAQDQDILCVNITQGTAVRLKDLMDGFVLLVDDQIQEPPSAKPEKIQKSEQFDYPKLQALVEAGRDMKFLMVEFSMSEEEIREKLEELKQQKRPYNRKK